MSEKVVFTITLQPDGRVDINGPLENKVICFGLLTIAQHLVHEYRKPGAIQVPRLVNPGLPPGNG